MPQFRTVIDALWILSCCFAPTNHEYLLTKVYIFPVWKRFSNVTSSTRMQKRQLPHRILNLRSLCCDPNKVMEKQKAKVLTQEAHWEHTQTISTPSPAFLMAEPHSTLNLR
ncbi:hypothetical protein GW17_00006497 [Ensete ventricosum]|nr:hypothetical protein GW17_00006497 [Ensete ventricosum]